jgi:hypothetical protein
MCPKNKDNYAFSGYRCDTVLNARTVLGNRRSSMKSPIKQGFWAVFAQILLNGATREGFEPPTSTLGPLHSIQLSYRVCVEDN